MGILNESFPIGLPMSEFYDFFGHMTEDSRTFLLQMPTYQQLILSLIVIISMLAGTLMKFFIYYNISMEKWSDKPINVLIVIDMVKGILPYIIYVVKKF